MASHRDGAALRSIHALFTAGTVAGLADTQLIERFATRDGDAAELAFAALVERHGPMVLRVCRAVLRDSHDAEDAFQAVFLVLAHKAGSLRARDALGPWLHGVALNVATTARAAASRRREHETMAAASRPRAEDAGGWDDLAPAVHEELGRLPGRYRAAVVLCLLEGLTREQAASQLGWPLGTVQSRLARGKERLRKRLTRRGLAPGAALTMALGSSEGARAAVPAVLAASTIRAATRFAAGEMAAGVVSASVLTLTEGVLRTMKLTKLLTVGVSGLLLGAVLAGAGVFAQPAEGPPPDRNATKPPLMKYELRIWRDGEPTGETIVAEATRGASVRVETTDGPLEIRPVPEREGQQGDGADGLRRRMRTPAARDGTNDNQTRADQPELAIDRLNRAERELEALNQQLQHAQNGQKSLKDAAAAILKSLGPGGEEQVGGLKRDVAQADKRVALLEAARHDLQRELYRLHGEPLDPLPADPSERPLDPLPAGTGLEPLDLPVVNRAETSGEPLDLPRHASSPDSLDQRMTAVEQKLDRILRALEGTKDSKELPPPPDRDRFPLELDEPGPSPTRPVPRR